MVGIFFNFMNDTKEIILKTAYTMFLFNNYEAVTINSIIRATGLTKGGIYHYYSSKEELFKAVVDKYMLENISDISTENFTLKELIDFTFEKSKKMISTLLNENEDLRNEIPINYITLMISACKYYPEYNKIGNKFFQNEKSQWEIVIKRAIKNKEIKDDIDIGATITNFLFLKSSVIANMIMGGTVMYALDTLERQFHELYKNIKI